MKLKTHRKINRTWYGNAGIFLMLGMVGAFMALPLVYAVVQAFKPFEELFIFPPRFFVRNPTLENFTILFQLTGNLWVPFSRYLFNSIFVSVVVTVGHVVIASMAAYPLAKHEFMGKMFIFNTIKYALLFSAPVMGIVQYIIVAKLGLINTYGAVILPNMAGAMGLYLMRQFMLGIHDSMLDSARIDGANEFKIFWSIVMPNMKPAWLTLIIFAFQGIWNLSGANVIYKESFKLLPQALGQITAGGIARAGVGAAISLLMMIPPITTFIITQSNVIETMSHSGMKE